MALRKWYENPGADNSFWVLPFQTTAQWDRSSAAVTTLRAGNRGVVNLRGNFAQPFYIGTASDPLIPITQSGTGKTIHVRIPIGAVAESPFTGTDNSMCGADTTQPYLIWQAGNALIDGGSSNAVKANSTITCGYGLAVDDASGPVMTDAVTGQPGTGNGYGVIQDFELSYAVADPNYVMQHMLQFALDPSMINTQVKWPLLVADNSFQDTGALPQGLTVGIPADVARPVGKSRGFYLLFDTFQQYGGFFYNVASNTCMTISCYSNGQSTANSALAQDIANSFSSVVQYICILTNQTGPSSVKGSATGGSNAFPPPPLLDYSPTSGKAVFPASFGAWYPSNYSPFGTAPDGSQVGFDVKSTVSAVSPTPTPTPVSPTPTGTGSVAVTPAAVLALFNSIKGKHTISGQFIERGPLTPIQDIFNNTGKWLGIIGGDYWWFGSTDTNADLTVNPILTSYWQAGGLVTLNFSMPNPSNGASSEGGGSFDATAAITPGNSVYTAFVATLDSIAAGLQQLQNAGVVVIVRPFHEFNGNWFFWGTQNVSASQFVALWRFVHDRLTQVKGLTNLIWLLSCNGGVASSFPVGSYYPGTNYVDMVGIDVYTDSPASLIDDYNAILQYGKPIAFAEYGPGSPSAGDTNFSETTLVNAFKNTLPNIVYWLQWWDGNGGNAGWGMAETQNVQQALSDPWVYNRGDFNFSVTPVPTPSTTPEVSPPPAPTPTPPSALTLQQAFWQAMSQEITANASIFVGLSIRTGDPQGSSGSPDEGVLNTPSAAVIKALLGSGI